jgi:hypothetical protein
VAVAVELGLPQESRVVLVVAVQIQTPLNPVVLVTRQASALVREMLVVLVLTTPVAVAVELLLLVLMPLLISMVEMVVLVQQAQ